MSRLASSERQLRNMFESASALGQHANPLRFGRESTGQHCQSKSSMGWRQHQLCQGHDRHSLSREQALVLLQKPPLLLGLACTTR